MVNDAATIVPSSAWTFLWCQAFIFLGNSYIHASGPRHLRYGGFRREYSEEYLTKVEIQLSESADTKAVEDEMYWNNYFEVLDSLSTYLPTNVPSTRGPTIIDTPNPSASPTKQFFVPDSESPTSLCQVDLELSCMFGDGAMSCEELLPEDRFVCDCPQCARQMLFTFTGGGCGDYAGCQDFGKTPDSDSLLLISNGSDPSDVLFLDSLTIGNQFVLAREDGSCIPNTLNVQISDRLGDEMLQTLFLDSSCQGTGLQLLSTYGALGVFGGFACSSDDFRSCSEDVLYEFDTCNTGSIELMLESLDFDVSGNDAQILSNGIPNDGLILAPNDCYKATLRSVVEKCTSQQYNAKAVVSARTDGTGILCSDNSIVQFGWDIVTSPPTRSPTTVPSPGPTVSPTDFPSQNPSLTPTLAPMEPIATPDPTASPTRVCSVDTDLICVQQEDPDASCASIDAEEESVCLCLSSCVNELFFLLTGNPCRESDDPARQCLDNGSFVSPARVVVTDSVNMNMVLFAGIREFGDRIVVQSENCLPESITVTVFSVGGTGTVLQSQTIDTRCAGGKGLTLTNSYGVLDFFGYSCVDESFSHNCLVNVRYQSRVCNLDVSNNLILFDMELDLNGSKESLLGMTAPRILEPGRCLIYSTPSTVKRCDGEPYSAVLTSSSSNEFDGAFCIDNEEVSFDTSPPTRQSRLGPPANSTIEDFFDNFVFNGTSEDDREENAANKDTENIRGGTNVSGPCEVRVEIGCRATIGSETDDCQNIMPTSMVECLGDSVEVQSLSFNVSNIEEDEVYLTIRDRDAKVYVQEIVSLGSIVHVLEPSDFLEVTVDSVYMDENERNQGDRVTRFMLDPHCYPGASEGSLELGMEYGNVLTLVAHKTDRYGLQSIYAQLEVQYRIMNPSSAYHLTVESAVVSSSLTNRLGNQLVVMDSDSAMHFGVPSMSAMTVLHARRTLNLWEGSGTAFVLAMQAMVSAIVAEGSADEKKIYCRDITTSIFRVGEDTAGQ